MSRQVIVAAAIVDGDPPRVLAAQRAYPADLAGYWELPGGKVHPGEDEAAALVRECQEELGVTVTVRDRVGEDVAIGPDLLLRVWWAQLSGSGQPRPLEHTQLRWLRLDQLDEVAWLPSDGPVMAAVRDGWPGA